MIALITSHHWVMLKKNVMNKVKPWQMRLQMPTNRSYAINIVKLQYSGTANHTDTSDLSASKQMLASFFSLYSKDMITSVQTT